MQCCPRLQNELFDLGAELATRDPQAKGTAAIDESQIAALEAAIDRFEEGLPPLKQFILPGGTRPRPCCTCAHGLPPGGARGGVPGCDPRGAVRPR